ncbi:uncharacterized protein LOC133316756 [Gastrolobium bilobum]|uniref:uncharacterized protein LOC133316756 n=1 Tax=Gastrolobium bilobum TaxID=150636 RepID=UPI002AB246D1|nr:uncharacterized protein LOC133316756 [Gastrolobium bilobum]
MNVSSGMGSSSGSSSIGARSQRRIASPRCKCGRPSVVYTSKTQRNPNKGFFGCLNSKEKKPYYDFFRRVADVIDDMMEVEDWRVNKLKLNIAEMEFKLNYLDMILNDQLQVKVNE